MSSDISGLARIDLLFDIDTVVKINKVKISHSRESHHEEGKYLILARTNKVFPEGVFPGIQIAGPDDYKSGKYSWGWEPKTRVEYKNERKNYDSETLEKAPEGSIFTISLIRNVFDMREEFLTRGFERRDFPNGDNEFNFRPGELEEMLKKATSQLTELLHSAKLNTKERQIYSRITGQYIA